MFWAYLREMIQGDSMRTRNNTAYGFEGKWQYQYIFSCVGWPHVAFIASQDMSTFWSLKKCVWAEFQNVVQQELQKALIEFALHVLSAVYRVATSTLPPPPKGALFHKEIFPIARLIKGTVIGLLKYSDGCISITMHLFVDVCDTRPASLSDPIKRLPPTEYLP